MKVCMLTTAYPRHTGDYFGAFIFGLGRQLVTMGTQLRVIAPHDMETPGVEEMDGIHVRRFLYAFPRNLQRLCYGDGGIPANVRSRPWILLQVPALLVGFLFAGWQESRKCDLVHGHWSLAGLAAWIIARLRGVPFILTMHGAEVFSSRGTMLTRFIINRADHLITNSTFTLNKILQIASPRSYSVIPFGVNPEKSRPLSAQTTHHVCRKFSIPSEHPIILFVGRLVERKGVQVLVDALPRVLARYPGVHLVIVGRGPMRDALEARVKQLAVEAHVTFAGFVTEEELNALYRVAAVFVLPAIQDPRGDTEGLGVVLLEAMLNGVAVVASQVGGITDIINSSDVGLLVEPGDPRQLSEAILCLLDDPLLRQIVSEKGQRRVHADFSWERLCEQTVRTYQGVLKV
jgi:glycosyltransferase involved in cell wall biosynthesis